MQNIHPTAIIDSTAEIGSDVLIGPYCVIGPNVTLGARCKLQSHVVIQGPSVIGSENVFYSFSSIGQQTQDLKYKGEPTKLEIGNRNTFREFTTVHRSTEVDGITKIGSGGNFLSYAHVAHDCVVGDEVIFSNNGTLGGHGRVGKRAYVGGLTAVLPFCRVGELAITGASSKISKDVPPFMLVDGNPAVIRGINQIGLERAKVSEETIQAIKEAYRILFRSKLNIRQAIEILERDLNTVSEIRVLIDFIRTSEKGIINRLVE